MGLAQLGQVGAHQAAEQLDLDLTDHLVADLVDQRGLADLGEAARQGQDGDDRGIDPQGGDALVDEQGLHGLAERLG